MTAVEIAPRTPRIADLEAAPVLELLALVPTEPEPLAALQIRPADTEGRVLLELASTALMARLEVDGDCSRLIALPRGPLAVLRRRHGDAERLVIDELEAGTGLRTFAADSTVAITCSQAAPLPQLPMAEPSEGQPAGGDALPVWLDPALLNKALGVLVRLGTAPVELALLNHPVVGAALRIRPRQDSGLSGAIQIARCVPPEAR